MRLDRHYWDVGGIVRVGPPGRLSLFGASLSNDDERPAAATVLVSDAGLTPDTASAFVNRYAAHHMSRLNVFWGVRDISFTTVRGFDALYATQDLPLGFQVGTLFGHTLSILGSKDDDIFVATDLYAAMGGDHHVTRLEVRGEGRRASPTGQWDGLLTSGRLSQLVKFASNQTSIASIEWAGAARSRIPFNLLLGALDGGVRGYKGSDEFGAGRAVARLEQRWAFGRLGNAATGVAVFANAGRVWAGDVPDGITSPIRAAVGVSLLGALPRQSHQLWRLDLTMAPGVPGGPPRFQLAFTGADNTRLFFQEPRDVERTRERTVPSSIYQWP